MSGPLFIMDYLILALATWRLSSLIVNEAGPWDLLAKARALIGIYYDDHSMLQGKNMIARAMICVWCSSVWVGIFVTVLYLIVPITTILLLPFALSAVAIIIEEFVNDKG